MASTIPKWGFPEQWSAGVERPRRTSKTPSPELDAMSTDPGDGGGYCHDFELFPSPYSIQFSEEDVAANGQECFDAGLWMHYSQPNIWSEDGYGSRNVANVSVCRDPLVDIDSLRSFTSGPSPPTPVVANGPIPQGCWPETNFGYVLRASPSPANDEWHDVGVGVQAEEPEDQKPVTRRRRGRPLKTTQRSPHRTVERKYRGRLNGEIDRLRLRVPTLPEKEWSSKAAVLAAAAGYIEQLDVEKKGLAEENEKLREENEKLRERTMRT